MYEVLIIDTRNIDLPLCPYHYHPSLSLLRSGAKPAVHMQGKAGWQAITCLMNYSSS